MIPSYSSSLDRLRQILNELRSQCPWDKKQTIQSLEPQTVEELYELVDQLRSNDWEGIKEELGDILLHLLFYTKIAEEQNQFTWEDVVKNIADKLVQRHPHIYSNVQVRDESEVKANWEKIKKNEGKKSVLSGVPDAAPAMNKAIIIQRKARNAGFDWDEKSQVVAKMQEEMNELIQAVAKGNQEEIEEEFGDILFSMINLSRFVQVDPERSLEQCNQKFIRRFTHMERAASQSQKSLQAMTLDEMEALWIAAKKELG